MKSDSSLLERITIVKGLMASMATIRAQRFTVADVIEMLESGMSKEQILEEHPVLEADDIDASLIYAKDNDIYKRHFPLDKL